MLNGVEVGGGGQEKSDKAEDPLQKEVEPQLPVASQGKGPPVCRQRPARETKRKVLFDDLYAGSDPTSHCRHRPNLCWSWSWRRP